MKKKKIKKRVTRKNSFPVFNLFKTTVFLLSAFFIFFTISPSLAQIGLMNGRFSTGLTDDYLFWLQTATDATPPIYTDHFYINKLGQVGIGTNSPGGKLEIRQAMSDFNTAFTSPHLKLKTTNMLNDTGFVGVTYDASTSNNYGWSVGALRRDSGQSSFVWKYHSNSAAGVEYMRIYEDGNVGINSSTPTAKLSINAGTGEAINVAGGRITDLAEPASSTDAVNKEYVDNNIASATSSQWILSGNNLYAASNDWNIGIGTTSPSATLTVGGGAYIHETLTMNADINMTGNDIVGINKLTVNTIDPLYRIKGVNYSTFAAAIVGGVKEEHIGRASLSRKNSKGEFEHVIDFNRQKEGSDLWVWFRTVDWSRDNVEVLMTPYGKFALYYYLIEDNKLILRSDRPVDLVYRLIGKRHDWREWPTRAIDQDETPGFIID